MNVKFKIEVEMDEHWKDIFLSMLSHMEKLGQLGCSRRVTLYSDGDGSFRPKFNPRIDYDYINPIKVEKNGDVIFDYGRESWDNQYGKR